MTYKEQIIDGFFNYCRTIGLVWLAAWICNPNVDSGTIWFVGVVAGLIVNMTTASTTRRCFR
jgi:hypothetical protein